MSMKCSYLFLLINCGLKFILLGITIYYNVTSCFLGPLAWKLFSTAILLCNSFLWFEMCFLYVEEDPVFVSILWAFVFFIRELSSLILRNINNQPITVNSCYFDVIVVAGRMFMSVCISVCMHTHMCRLLLLFVLTWVYIFPVFSWVWSASLDWSFPSCIFWGIPTPASDFSLGPLAKSQLSFS